MTKTLTLRAFDLPAIHKFGIGFDSLFGFKYSVRPDTKAADLNDDVPLTKKEKRLEKVLDGTITR